MSTPAKLRYLWAFSAADEWTVAWHERNLALRRSLGYDIEMFCVTPPSLGRQWLPFPELDRMWRAGHRPLMEMYENLAAATAGRDVLVLYNGANLHPDFVRQMGILKVYTVGDPESAEILGRPMCGPFDIVFVYHASDVARYRSWGKEHVYFLPMGSVTMEDEVSDLTEEKILDPERRSIPVTLICERSRYRNDELERLVGQFPQAFVAGRGWPRGFVGWNKMWEVYRGSRIGWNMHNSIGFNFRTYELPAYGVMEICDDKSRLSRIFDLGREMVGYETVEECVELTRYYLEHTDEQRRIAADGWLRWKREYTPGRVWEKLAGTVEKHCRNAGEASKSGGGSDQLVISLREHCANCRFYSILYKLRVLLRPFKCLLLRFAHKISGA